MVARADFDGQESGAASIRPAVATLCALVVFVYAWLAATTPPQAFTVDEHFYAEMARAMASEGRVTIRQMHLEGAPSLDMAYAHELDDGRLAPQYPSGYAVLSAPFQLAFGPRGLILLNAFAGLVSILLVRRIARRISGHEPTATLAAALFAVGSMAPTYFFAIWPHMTGLAFLLAGSLATLASVEGNPRARFVRGTLAGLAFAVAASLRLDAVLAVMAAVAWLRFMVGGRTRTIALGVFVGFAPGLLFLAVTNEAKFGVFNPFSYQAAGGSADPGRYAPIAIGLLVVAAFGFVFDPPSLARAMRERLSHGLSPSAAITSPNAAAIWAAFLVLAAFVVVPPFRTLAVDAAGLVVDLGLGPVGSAEHGATREAGGVVSVFGAPKKSLLESMPYAPVAAASLWALLMGWSRRGEGLLWLLAGAFIGFYSLTRWHGGLSLNMRYLLPAAPAIAVLAASSLRRLRPAAFPPRALGLAFAFGAVVVAAGFLQSLHGGPRATAFALLPPLAFSGALCLALCLDCTQRLAMDAAKTRRGASDAVILAAAAAMGAGIASGLSDAARDRLIRSAFAKRAEVYAEATPPGSLFLTGDPVRAFSVRLKASVAHPGLVDTERLLRAISAYETSGACVLADADAADGLRRAQLGLRIGATLGSPGAAGVARIRLNSVEKSLDDPCRAR